MSGAWCEQPSAWSQWAMLFARPSALVAEPIWAGGAGARYALLRREIVVFSKVQSAVAYVAAAQSGPIEKLLGSYRLYVGGRAVGVGPGRGDARTAAYPHGGDVNHTMYDTIDVSATVGAAATVSGGVVLGLQCYHPTGDKTAGVLLELHLRFANGTAAIVSTSSTDGAWQTFDATHAFGPTAQTGMYHAPQEWILEDAMPRGWTQSGFQPSTQWALASTRIATSPSLAPALLRPKPTLALALQEGTKPARFNQVGPGEWFADFGHEVMGGLSLRLPRSVFPQGTQLQVTLGEELVGDHKTSTTILYPMRTGNTYRHVWTVGTGDAPFATFENHEFMVFRYATVQLSPTYNSTATCTEVDESADEHTPTSLSVHCESHVTGADVIGSIEFASYGTPSGGCDEDGGKGSLLVNASCHAASSETVATKACVGRNQCTLQVDNNAFGGDPCHRIRKRLALCVSCKKPPATGGDASSSESSRDLNLTAWTVAYPWVDDDSSFESSLPALDRVWALARDTLKTTSLDTATDSNTRERLPYEADGEHKPTQTLASCRQSCARALAWTGYITGLSRLALQADVEWPRHSSRHNIINPTWPTEWRQTVSLLAYTDWSHGGSTSLYDVFGASLLEQTQAACVNDATDLVDFSSCKRRTGSYGAGNEARLRDIVDWPPLARDGYMLTSINTVVNAYAAGGLNALSELANATGDAKTASELRLKASRITNAINRRLFDQPSGLYVDGADDTGAPLNHTAWHASVFPAAFGLVPRERWPKLLAMFRSRGMVGSVYAAYWLLRALYNLESDGGYLALAILSACTQNSWCSMLAQGATATMEAWTTDEKPNLSWSHPWASSPASAVVWGLFGLRATKPTFKEMRVRPQPGNLSSATIKVPTRRGPIQAHIRQHFAADSTTPTAFNLTLSVPASTSATACVPRLGSASPSVLLDGKVVTGALDEDFVCVAHIGSSAQPHTIVRRAAGL